MNNTDLRLLTTIPGGLFPELSDCGTSEVGDETDDLRVCINTAGGVRFVLESRDQVRVDEKGDWLIYRHQPIVEEKSE